MSTALRIGGFVPCSSTDWPDQLAAVVFVAGCPWRCHYCHNPHLQSREHPAAHHWGEVLELLDQRRGLLDGVVFSGGEPTVDRALPQALEETRARGFATALHTAGAYPARLEAVLDRLDWVGLDIKTQPGHYTELTGAAGSAERAWDSLRLLQASGVDHEVRITAHPAWLPAARLNSLINDLAAQGVRQLAVQPARVAGACVPADYLAALAAPHWQHDFARFTLRA